MDEGHVVGQLMIIKPCIRIKYVHTHIQAYSFFVFHFQKHWVRFQYICYVGISFKIMPSVILVLVIQEKVNVLSDSIGEKSIYKMQCY